MKDKEGPPEKKTRRLDDDHFAQIADKVRNSPGMADTDKTQIIRGAEQSSSPRVEASNKTKVFRSSSPNDVDQVNMDDPPSGWLVAIDGPGKGSILTLGIGANAIGRGDDVRVPITFNDDQISRGRSFSVLYDPRNRQFFLTQGDGKSLIYIDNNPILESTKIESGVELSIGQTVFKFVALCGETFDWSEERT